MIGLPAILVATVARGAVQEGPPVFGVDVEVVRVEVLVTREGEPVRGLTARNFELRDEGVPQRLNPIAFEEAPVDALLVLDLSGSVMGSKLEALRSAARAFLDQLTPRDRAALAGFQNAITAALPLTSDIPRVRFALDAVEGGGSTALHDAVYVALRLTDPGPRRKAIVVFSDGIDNVSWLSREDVVQAVARSEAVVYGVDARGPGDPSHRFLKDVAKVTGGRVFRAGKIQELRARFLDVLEDIRSRYVLSYTPSGVDTAGWHEIEVGLRGVRGDVLARPAYFRPARERTP
jgi:Ca-activated chloride channel family protein